MELDYYQKYIKYKTKYRKLQSGGGGKYRNGAS